MWDFELIWTISVRSKLHKKESVFADDETDGVGTDGDVDGGYGLVAEQTSVKADGGASEVEHVDIADARGMNVAVIEELTFAKQPEATEQLPNGGSGDDRHVE